MNKGKRAKIEGHFNSTLILKNGMSAYIFTQLPKLFLKETRDKLFSEYKDYKPSFLSAWETQALWQDIISFYGETIFRRLEKIFTKKVQKSVTIIRYKVNTKLNKKGDIKTIRREWKTTSMCEIVRYCGVFDIEIDTNLEQFKKYEKPYALLSFYKENKPEKYARLIAIKNSAKSRAFKRIKPIVFKTGSHRRVAVLSGSITNEIIVDKSNKKFKTWYSVNLPKQPNIYLPLESNPKFHGDLSQYNLNSIQTVSYKNNKLRLGLLREATVPEFLSNPKKEIGVDVGFARHFFACTTKDNKRISFKSGNGYIEGLVEKLKKIDAMIGESDDLKNCGQLEKAKNKRVLAQKRLKNIISKNQWFMESLVSEFLKTLIKEGYTDITMEDLELHLTNAGVAKVSGLRLTRMVRMLRLSSFKSMVVTQAEKKGLRVHLVHAQYSSQECSKCHHASKLNRKGEVFKCTQCGHTDESDFQGGGNLLSRKLFHPELLTQDGLGRYKPLKRSNHQIKEVIQNNNKPYPFSECFGKSKVLVLEPKILKDGSLRCIVLPESPDSNLKSV